ncbi:hypothetical protein [Actinoplanes utahensis]|uniref:hypothetical protein n=1 Tax=Actinoplanes utahensis TaxID=1869 RepID=UPI001269B1C6|nr:hypothetical protein [Actinoplanes utahensis]GIF32447.1 hypothetical protein Aut01nite_54330 [Actinoplanes utahensis]
MRLFSTLGAAVAVLGALLVASPAQAAAPAKTCVINLSAGNTMTCHTTFTKAVAAATGGYITDAPDTAGKALTDRSFQGRLNETEKVKSHQATTAQAATVLSIDYDGTGTGGTSFIWSGDNGCTATSTDVDYFVNSMPSGWNDRVSSNLTYANCWVNYWEHNNHTGSSTGYAGSRNNLGVMNNQASSERWS